MADFSSWAYMLIALLVFLLESHEDGWNTDFFGLWLIAATIWPLWVMFCYASDCLKVKRG